MAKFNARAPFLCYGLLRRLPSSGKPATLARSLDAFPLLFLSAVKVFEFLLADPNAILAVVYVDRITNKSNTGTKTKKQIELMVVFNSFEVDVINGRTGT
jgi:hypothetical protein